MAYVENTLKIPINQSTSAAHLAKWLLKENIHKKKHPTLVVQEEELISAFALMAAFIFIASALIILEEKGKIKTKKQQKGTNPSSFLSMITHAKTDQKIEELIEQRYDLNLRIDKSPLHQAKVSEPKAKYGLDDVFGIWKNKKVSLENIREDQWGKRK